MWEKNSRIALALDVKNKKQAFDLLDKIHEHIDIIKFNYPLILTEGIQIISEIKKNYKKTILADFKVADVPVTNNKIAKIAHDSGADGIMVHGFIGVDAICSIKETVPEIKIFLVTQLTNPGGLEFTSKFTEDFATVAKTLELFGVQAPGTRPEVVKKVRSIIGEKLKIICCGIGKQGGKFGHAIKAGADWEIIGRSIYQDKDPLNKVLKIKRIIKEVANL